VPIIHVDGGSWNVDHDRISARQIGLSRTGKEIRIEDRKKKRQYDVLLLRNVQMPILADFTVLINYLFRLHILVPTELHRVCSVKVSDLFPSGIGSHVIIAMVKP
jgi:hypothetical protein